MQSQRLDQLILYPVDRLGVLNPCRKSLHPVKISLEESTCYLVDRLGVLSQYLVSSISETTSDYVKKYMDDLNKRLAVERDVAERKARSLAETKRKYPVQGRTKYLQSGSDAAQRLAKLRSLASQMTYYSGVAERANKAVNDVAPQNLLEQLNALSVVDRSKVDDYYHKYYDKA